MRKIAETYLVAGVEVRVYRNPEWDEYEVRPYLYGKLATEWVYHTSDKTDALNSMKRMHCDILESRVEQVVIDGEAAI